MKKAAFYTLGCKVNQYETQAVIEIFKNADYEIVGFDEEADVYVINTCTVTGLSDRKSRQIIRRAKHMAPNSVVVAMGCYSQVAAEEVASLSEVDLVIGTQNRKEILKYINELNGQKLNTVQEFGKAQYEDLGVSVSESRTRATLKIQDGCNQFCSYCIIPYARGPARSRSLEDTVGEAKRLAENGFKEVVLTGINLSLYKESLTDLITGISNLEGIKRIRLGSMEPAMITREFADFAASCEKLCPHFHISLQSGSDATLKRMNRKYNSGEYEAGVNLLRSAIRDASISTDVIVGFPGETEEEFAETYAFLDSISFSKMHVFKYSVRKGTAAAKFAGQVLPSVKDERSRRLIELSDRKALEFNSNFIGREMPVLIEQAAAEIEGYVEGLTPNYIRVVCPGDESLKGEIIKVKIFEVGKDHIIGRVNVGE